MMKENLLQKIEARQAKIGVVGAGYVGLPLAVAFAKEGFDVLALDVNAQKSCLVTRRRKLY